MKKKYFLTILFLIAFKNNIIYSKMVKNLTNYGVFTSEQVLNILSKKSSIEEIKNISIINPCYKTLSSKIINTKFSEQDCNDKLKDIDILVKKNENPGIIKNMFEWIKNRTVHAIPKFVVNPFR